MITIKIDNPNKIKPTSLCKKSGFISFDYDSNLVQFMRDLGNRAYLPDTKEWEVPASSVPMIVDKLTDYEIKLVGILEREENTAISLPDNFEFKTKPYNHQIEGVLHGLKNDCFLLGDDQGLGKTKQIIDLAVCRKRSEGLKHCLIICGINGTKYNWKEEVKIHSEEDAWVLGTRYNKSGAVIEGGSKEKLEDLNNCPKHFFWITNIETLRGLSRKEGTGRNSKRIYPIADKIQELCKNGTIGMVAFDEAHKAKNPDSQQGEALLQIEPKYAIPMSGTFVLNNPMDLYLPLRWAGFENHNFYQYKKHYCIMGGFNNRDIIGYKNLPELRNIMSEVMLRRTKSDVLDLPPKVYSTEYVEMTKEQKKLYNDVKKNLREELDKIRLHPDPLSEMLRLRQVTGYPGSISTTITESSKMDRLCEIVEEVTSQNEKVIVYSQWSTMTNIMRDKLRKYNPAYITGEVKSEERMDEVNRFQNHPDCKVIIGTIGAMGTGLTLTAASTVIFLDEPWNRSIKDQAEDRAHRIGTKGTVRIVTLVTKDSIDEGISQLVQKKGRMADMLVDGKFNQSDRREVIDYLFSLG